MSILGERLTEAIKSKKNDINTFVWKGEKKEIGGKFVQDEVLLIDCTQEELQEHYNYCKTMLYNQDKVKPGRYVLLSIINDQMDRCNTELFLRWLKTEKQKGMFTFAAELKRVIDDNKEVITDLKAYPISGMVSGIPDEFSNISVNLVLDGCLDKLGRFDKRHITLTFILKQGVWCTPDELKELTIINSDGTVRDRLEVIKENLLINNNLSLKITPKGLTYSQLRSMTTLKSKKYSQLTTDQLKVLRNRILFALGDECRFHIKQWEQRMNQIEMVAEAKNFTLSI